MKKKASSKLKIIISLLCIVLCVLAFAIIRNAYYSKHFVNNVQINGIDVGNKTLDETIDIIASDIDGMITIHDGVATSTVKLSDFIDNVSLDQPTTLAISNVLEDTTFFERIFGKKSYCIDNKIEILYNDVSLKKISGDELKQLVDLKDNNRVFNEDDIRVEWNGNNEKYEIFLGKNTKIDYAILSEDISSFIKANVVKNGSNCDYEILTLSYYMGDKRDDFIKECDLFNGVLNSYRFAIRFEDHSDSLTQITSGDIYQWIVKDENNKIKLNEIDANKYMVSFDENVMNEYFQTLALTDKFYNMDIKAFFYAWHEDFDDTIVDASDNSVKLIKNDKAVITCPIYKCIQLEYTNREDAIQYAANDMFGLSFGTQTWWVDEDILLSWCKTTPNDDVMIDFDGKLSYSYDKIYAAIENINVSLVGLDNLNGANIMPFINHNNEFVPIPNKKYFFKMDSLATTDAIYDYLTSEDRDNNIIDAIYESSGYNTQVLSNYVEVSIDAQHLYYYQNNKLVLDCDVVTGTLGRRDTNKGYQSILNKAKNIYLVGPTWRTHVDYWMAINHDGEGLHDASWRKGVFGGEIYKTDGSHGCVNMPLDSVAELYEIISVGEPVIIY